MKRMNMNRKTRGLFSVLVAVAMLAAILIGAAVADDEKEKAEELYKRANRQLGRGNYEEAAEHFGKLYEQYRLSELANESRYWEAYSLYQLGGKRQLNHALESLSDLYEVKISSELSLQSEELTIRIDDALRRVHGDAGAAIRLAERLADLDISVNVDPNIIVMDADGNLISGEYDEYIAHINSDDLVIVSKDDRRSRARTREREKEQKLSQEMEMKLTALNALMHMDPENALPIIKKLLANRGEENKPLREHVLFILSQYDDEEAEAIMIDVLENDPDPEIQGRAVFWLGQMESEAAMDAIEEIAMKSDDESLRENALFALSQQDSPRAGKLLMEIAKDKKSSNEIRGRAIFWLGQRDEGGEMEFLRELYREIEVVEIREQVLFAVAQNDDEEESLEWLIGIAKDKDEAMELRTRAIFWAGQMGDLPVDALGSLYEDAEDREMKEQVLFGIAQQDSKEAVTLLMEIARNEDDVALKTNIIFWIGQSDDSRVPSFLEEIITR